MKKPLLLHFGIVVFTILALANCESPSDPAASPDPPTPAASAIVINIAAIQGISVPATGGTPVSTITENTQYSGAVTWSSNHPTFAASTVYTATITLTAKTGFTLQGVAANFFRVAGALLTSNNANSGVIAAVFPATGGTEANPTIISIAAIDGLAPVTGETPVTIIDNAQYSGTVIWTPVVSGNFAAVTAYTAGITLMPKTGYTLQGIPANFFTVAGATRGENAANSGVITATFPATGAINIPFVSLIIIAPVKGETPGTTASDSEEGGNFTIGTVSWSPANNPFLGNTAYTATVTLTANSGYTFAGLSSASVNGQSAAVSNNTGSAVTLSHTFSKTDEKTVSIIAIKNQPTNLNYTHGDTLDLAGLVVTLTHDDATAEDVAAANFADKNITANPAAGNSLNYSAHNGKPVTITYGNLTKNTNNLTVNRATPVAGDFTISGTGTFIYDGNTKAVTVTPKEGKSTGTRTIKYNGGTTAPSAAGTYTVTFDVAAAGDFNAVSGLAAGTLTVDKAEGAAVSSPTLNAKTHNSITINAVSVQSTGQSVEYAINESNAAPSAGWQTTTTFSSLNTGTTYYIFARSVSNGNYTTGIPSSGLIVTTLQTVLTDRIEYYWVNEHGSLVTTSGGATTVASGSTLAITAQGTGYIVEWYLNGVNTEQSGDTYNFSSTTAGKHTVGLFVEKDGKLYNTNITVTVQ